MNTARDEKDEFMLIAYSSKRNLVSNSLNIILIIQTIAAVYFEIHVYKYKMYTKINNTNISVNYLDHVVAVVFFFC